MSRSWADVVTVGQIIPCDILPGEVADGRAAGLGAGYALRGVGLVRMRDVYHPDELTEFCRDEDTCWGAEVLEEIAEDHEGHDDPRSECPLCRAILLQYR